MKVLDLRCGNDHRFEGWFGSDEDFQAQESRGLVQCPICADGQVVRLPSAPRLNVSGLREEPAAAVPDVPLLLQVARGTASTATTGRPPATRAAMRRVQLASSMIVCSFPR